MEPSLNWTWGAGFYFLGAVGTTWGLHQILKFRLRDSSGRVSLAGITADSAIDLIVHGFALLSLAAWFGSSIYPNLKPSYGGGGVWIATLAPPSVLTIVDAKGEPERKVAVVDRDTDFTRLLVCYTDGSGGGSVEKIEVDRQKLDYLHVMSTSTVQQFADDCEHLPDRRP
jgi:hypothetical protein